MLSEWGFFSIYAGSISTLYIVVSNLLRRKYDTNTNGKIDADEVPFRKRTRHMEVKMEEPFYDDLSIMSFIRVGIEAMLHSFCYGCLIVFSMNLIMSNMGNPRYLYLLTCVMIHMACMFMCMVATNGIHVITSHTIHFLYYGFSNIPLVFLWRIPDREYLVAVAPILYLIIYSISRQVALPGYPNLFEVGRMYKLDDTSGLWVPKSGPSSEYGETGSIWYYFFPGPALKEYAKWAVAFPVYEIVNVHISSSFTIGVLCGVATSMLVGHSDFLNAGVVSNESLIMSVLVAGVVVQAIKLFVYGRAENKMHSLTLYRYHPKIVATLSAMLGAAAAVIQLEHFSNGDGATDIVYWVGVGAFIIKFCLTFIISFWAKYQYTSKDEVENIMKDPIL